MAQILVLVKSEGFLCLQSFSLAVVVSLRHDTFDWPMEERRGRSLDDQTLNARIREKLHPNIILRRSGVKKELWRFAVYEDDRPPNICPIEAGKF